MCVDVLHDLAGLFPNGGRRGRLNKRYGETGTEICHVEDTTEIDPSPPFLWNRVLVLFQVVNLLCGFVLLKKETAPGEPNAVSKAIEGRKKDAAKASSRGRFQLRYSFEHGQFTTLGFTKQ